jgi:hypothetical protein
MQSVIALKRILYALDTVSPPSDYKISQGKRKVCRKMKRKNKWLTVGIKKQSVGTVRKQAGFVLGLTG